MGHHLKSKSWLIIVSWLGLAHLVAGVQGQLVPGPHQDGQRVAAPRDALQADVGAQVKWANQRRKGDVMVIIDHRGRGGH